MVTHTWVTRAHCPECDQTFWTNPGSPNVYCSCGASGIVGDVLVGNAEDITDEDFFLQEVKDDLHTDDVELEH